MNVLLSIEQYYYQLYKSIASSSTVPITDPQGTSQTSTISPNNVTNDLSGKNFSTITGAKSQVYTTGKANGNGAVVTKPLNATGNIQSEILPHHRFREARTNVIFPGMTESQIISAGYGNPQEIKSHDFTVSGRDVRAHVPFRVISANNSGPGSLVLQLLYPGGRKERAQFLHGDIPPEILKAANKDGQGKIFDGGTTFYLESGKGPNGASQYPKHTDMQSKTSVVADLLKANMQGQYLSYRGSGTDSTVLASNQNRTLARES